MGKYLDLLVFVIGGAAFPLGVVGLGGMLRRSYPDPEKGRAYESGEIPFGDARVRFHIGYYVFALIYLIFDVESIFLFPWAMQYTHLSRGLAFGEVVVFVVMLLIGWFYAWRKKVLTWM